MTVYCELVAACEGLGGYVTYVFQNLDASNDYIMCTKFPNWETPPIKIRTIGFLKYKEIIAGRDQWFSPEDGNFYVYKYNGIQFLNFVAGNKYSPDYNIIL